VTRPRSESSLIEIDIASAGAGSRYARCARAAAAPGVSRSEAEPPGVVPAPQRSLDRVALSRRAGRTNGVEMPGDVAALKVGR
jgi:hypothetical protein